MAYQKRCPACGDLAGPRERCGCTKSKGAAGAGAPDRLGMKKMKKKVISIISRKGERVNDRNKAF